jgi:hypothetical protein
VRLLDFVGFLLIIFGLDDNFVNIVNFLINLS